MSSLSLKSQLIHRILDAFPAKSDEAVILFVHHAIYYVQVADKKLYSDVQFDEVYEDSDMANNTHSMPTSRLTNILSVTLGDHIHLLSYKPQPDSYMDYKFPPLPQLASFTVSHCHIHVLLLPLLFQRGVIEVQASTPGLL